MKSISMKPSSTICTDQRNISTHVEIRLQSEFNLVIRCLRILQGRDLANQHERILQQQSYLFIVKNFCAWLYGDTFHLHVIVPEQILYFTLRLLESSYPFKLTDALSSVLFVLSSISLLLSQWLFRIVILIHIAL